MLLKEVLNRTVAFRAYAVFVLVLTTAASLLTSGVSARAAVDQPSPLEYLGDLSKFPDADGVVTQSDSVVGIDGPRERLYYTYASTKGSGFEVYLVEYDLKPDVPVALREVTLGPISDLGQDFSPYTSAIDNERNRLYLVSLSGQTSTITVVDLESLHVEATWDLAATLPGLSAKGLTYEPRDDRLYVVGEMSASPLANPAMGEATVAAVASIDPDDGSRLWMRPVPECRKLGDVYKTGALIASSASQPRVTFFCRHLFSFVPAGNVRNVGQPGLVRIGFPADAGQSEAGGFGVQFFPISGTYTTGEGGAAVAAFDRSTDRFFVQSVSTSTPGAWIFDGRVGAWVGFVAGLSDDGLNQPRFNGFDPHTGHFYMGAPDHAPTSKKGYMIVTDGRATPVPAGTFVDQPTYNFVVPDPNSARMFVRTGSRQWSVFRDNVGQIHRGEALDHDALTEDVPEGPDTFANFTGTSGGYAARVTLIGGFESATTSSEDISSVKSIVGAFLGAADQDAPFDPTFGDRGVTLAGVPAVDLLKVTTTASAQSLSRDEATGTDVQKLRAAAGDEEGTDEQRDAASWPYDLLECSDGSGEAEEKQHAGPAGLGTSKVSCDLAAERTSGHSVVQATGGEGPLTIGSGSFDTTVHRDPDLGTVTDTTTSVDGLHLSLDGNGSLEIGRIMASSTTVAAGRTGTASARWVRRIESVTVRDAEGNQVFPSEPGQGSCVTIASADDGETQTLGSCRELVDALNSVLHTRVQVRLPQPDLVATPKGAFAQVRQSQADYLDELNVRNDADPVVPALDIALYNDAQEKSRVVATFAALRADSLYTITRFSSPDGGDPGTDIGLGFDAGDGPVPEPGVDVHAPPRSDPAGQPGEVADQQLIDELATFLSNVNPDALAGATVPQTAPPDSGTDEEQVPGTFPDPGQPADPGVDAGLAAGPSVEIGQAPTLDQDVGGDSPPPEVAPEAADAADAAVAPSVADRGQERTLDSRFLSRSASDAAAVGGIWLLFLGALATALRRTSLLQLLGSR